MSRLQQLYDPAQAFTVKATGGPVPDNTIVKVAAAKANGEATPVAPATASDEPLGAVTTGAIDGGLTACYAGGVQDIVASGAIAAGVAVQLAAGGAVATYSDGRKVGVSLAAAANGLVLVKIHL